MSIIDKFNNIILSLIYDGDSWLRDYEVKLLFSYFNTLNEIDRKKFHEQFKLFNNVQRGRNGKMIRFSQLSDQFRKKWNKEILFQSDFDNHWSLDIKINTKIEPLRFSINFGKGAIVELNIKNIPLTFEDKFIRIFDVSIFFEKNYESLAESFSNVELGPPKQIRDC